MFLTISFIYKIPKVGSISELTFGFCARLKIYSFLIGYKHLIHFMQTNILVFILVLLNLCIISEKISGVVNIILL